MNTKKRTASRVVDPSQRREYTPEDTPKGQTAEEKLTVKDPVPPKKRVKK